MQMEGSRWEDKVVKVENLLRQWLLSHFREHKHNQAMDFKAPMAALKTKNLFQLYLQSLRSKDNSEMAVADA